MATHTPSYFDLNIGEILESWEPRHAVREIIANALDEQALTGTADVEVKKVDDSWIVRDAGRGLRVEHLKQNESAEKLDAANVSKVVGRFGVGLKDALATLHRRNVQIAIHSQHHDIAVAERPKAGFEEVQTLHAVVSPPTEPQRAGTTIILRGIDDAEIGAAKDFFLRFSGEEILGETPYGQILRRDPQRPARVFIKGVLVAEDARFAFSYNVTSLTAAMTKALNRERTNVGRTAFADRIKVMLLACDAPVVAKMLAQELQGVEEGTAHDEITWLDVAIHACKILNQTNSVVFVSARELAEHPDAIDEAQSDGNEIITLPQNIRDKLRNVSDFTGRPVQSLDEFNRQRAESFRFDFVDEAHLTVAERAVYSRRHDIAGLAGGLPEAVRAVVVTNTMRPDEAGRTDALGLWDRAEGRIIIRRDQLRSLDRFAGTLLHEITHASSGAGDVSRQFELALTELIGHLAKRALAQDTASDRVAETPEANGSSRVGTTTDNDDIRREVTLAAFHGLRPNNDITVEKFLGVLHDRQGMWPIVGSLGVVEFAQAIAGRQISIAPELRRTRINEGQKSSIKGAILSVLENQSAGMNRHQVTATIIAKGLTPHGIEHGTLEAKTRQPLHELVAEKKLHTVGQKRLMKYVLSPSVKKAK